jgi:glucosamine-6-phosphate deaminase
VDVRFFASAEDLAQAVAQRVTTALRERPDIVLGVPAGRTPVGVYAELVRLHAVGQASFSHATAFALDEFVGIDRVHRASFHRFHALNGIADDLQTECERYEDVLSHVGGIGLQLLGIGGNGHIGFNEPAADLVARTHLVALLESTRRASAALFNGDFTRVPHQALTMGVGTILKAETIILLASGESKAASIERMVRGPITPQLPASFLQAHRRVEVYLDRAAASRL